MILRSVMRHVHDQNWFAVFLDFLIVVVGVFIGIQVANWNEVRREDAAGRAYLGRIQEDLAVDRATLKGRGRFWSVVQEYGEGALGYLEDGSLVDASAWKTLLALYHATQVWGFSLYEPTYREMISAGDLRLIPDPELRRALGDYYGVNFDQKNFVFQMIPPYRDTVRGMMPWEVQNYIWASCFESWGLDRYRLLDCDSPIPEERAQPLLDRFAARVEVTEQLRNWLRNLELMLIWQVQMTEVSSELDRRIERSMENRDTGTRE
ncbi:hypothetical protein [Halomonas denitrificans]|nr:hypothetical protein [Halomonas denitrificans]